MTQNHIDGTPHSRNSLLRPDGTATVHRNFVDRKAPSPASYWHSTPFPASCRRMSRQRVFYVAARCPEKHCGKKYFARMPVDDGNVDGRSER